MSKKYKKIQIIAILLVLLLISVGAILYLKSLSPAQKEKRTEIIKTTITPTASPSASPTPRKLSFAEMNKLYGPCTDLPVLMYHHVEPKEDAKKNKRTGLNVEPELFKKHMEYILAKGYTPVSPSDLVNFFDNGTPLAKKPILITFDDGYVDLGDTVFPIMQNLGIKGSIYLPTGLMENFDYLTWVKIMEMNSSGLFTFGNHTWSHINVAKNRDLVKKEIVAADTQLADRGLNNPKTFVYPYGLESAYAEQLLAEMNYKLAFTTQYGRTMCKKQRLSLPRIRIGNTSLSYFGL